MWEVPEPECWLHPDVEVRTSGIAGQGLFARAPLPVGTTVSLLGGRLVTAEGLRELFDLAAGQPGRPYIDTIAVAEGAHLVLPPGNLNGRGNHGCDPNLWWVGPYALATRRDIDPGDELTNDYATSTAAAGFAMACRCGSPLCRRTVTGDDWRLPELRRRYGDHWTPALLALIRTSA